MFAMQQLGAPQSRGNSIVTLEGRGDKGLACAAARCTQLDRLHMRIKSQAHLQARLISTRTQQTAGAVLKDSESASGDQLPVWKRVESEH
jgi:hypothetical protein